MTEKYYFSDEEIGSKTRDIEEITENIWGGILAAIQKRVNDGSFGQSFPDICGDGHVTCGCNAASFYDALLGDIPDIPLPITARNVPPKLAILDAIEFCFKHTAKSIQLEYHPFMKHHHLRFEKEKGQWEFQEDMNRILARNGLAYKLEDNGQIIRLAAEPLRQALTTTFNTGDPTLDQLLTEAKNKFLNPDPKVRRESIEKLWDAWERTKTLEEPRNNKKGSITNLIVKASPEPDFRERLNKEATELTNIGNTFQIRHFETGKTPIQDDGQVDYLFHRLFSLILLLSRRS